MYKLVAIGGKLRGQEFVLNEGENVLGRDVACDHALGVQGVSKKHMSITVTGNTAYVQDLGSSNGTFVNGKLIKKKTVKNKDKVALPNVIFQLVYVKEKKTIVKKQIVKGSEDEDEAYSEIERMPDHIPGKIRYLFKHKIMPVLYGFNESYEWSILLGILLMLFVAINIALTIAPVLRNSMNILEYEISERGKQYAREVSRANSIHLKQRSYDQIVTSFLENDSAIIDYDILEANNDGIIVAPRERRNRNTNDPFTITAIRKILKNLESNNAKPFLKKTGAGTIGVAAPIMAYDTNLGRQIAVGIISLKFAPKSLVAATSNNSRAYMEALATSALVAVLFFAFIYYLTMKPVEEMRGQIENVLRGKQKELESKLLMKEVGPLRNQINSILQRLREMQSTETGDFQDLEDDGPYLRTLEEFMRGAMGPAMVLNSEKLIQNINSEGEDLTGLRESSASGTSLLDSLRDQGFAATVIDLCDQSANNDGCNQQEVYEINGKELQINIVSMIGKDSFAKGFYVTFVEDA
jgi:hypothetical protein